MGTVSKQWSQLATVYFQGTSSKPAGHKIKENQPRETFVRVVSLDGKKQIFVVPVEHLRVAWISDVLYWHKKTITAMLGRELRLNNIEVAELQNVQWLDISGNFSTHVLLRDTEYEIILHVMLTEDFSGLDSLKYKVTFSHEKEKGTGKEQALKFNEGKPVGSWQEVLLREFRTQKELVQDEEVKFSIYCHKRSWKRGLVLGCVSFTPKSSNCSSTARLPGD